MKGAGRPVRVRVFACSRPTRRESTQIGQTRISVRPALGEQKLDSESAMRRNACLGPGGESQGRLG